MDTNDTLRKRFWTLKGEVDGLDKESSRLRAAFNDAHATHQARYDREVKPLADAFKAYEAKADMWAKKQEMADITKFLRDPVTGIAKMGPKP